MLAILTDKYAPAAGKHLKNNSSRRKPLAFFCPGIYLKEIQNPQSKKIIDKIF